MIATTRDRNFGRDAVGLFSAPRRSRRSRLYDENIEGFSTVIEYLTHLRNNEDLTDKAYSTLISLACAKFVENEMAIVINKMLGNTVKNFKKIFEEYPDEWR